MNKIFKYSLWLLLPLFFACSEEGLEDSGKGTLSGKVVTNGDNLPLENVKIETSPASNTVFTDAEGNFTIANIQSGEYSVSAQLEGYTTAFKAANVQNGQTSNVVFELKKSTANNQPPTVPQLISPAENEVLANIEVVFIWSSTEPDEDEVTYTLELRNDVNNDVEIFEDITDTLYVHSPLMYGAKYFWQVTADDGINTPVNSLVSSFTVQAAPADNRILFARNTNGNLVIYSSDEEGNEFQLTSSVENSFRPRRNVAANKIAFFKTQGAYTDIYTMNRDGSGVTKVTTATKPNGFNLSEINFCWPHNSDQIYFPSFDKLYRINSNSQGLQLVYQTPDGSLISEVDVNVQFNMIALKTNNINGYDVKIFVTNLSGEHQYDVLTGVDGAASGLHISADGQKILYSYDISGFQSAEYRRMQSRIFLYEVAGGTATDISGDTPSGTNDLDPRFSPNEAFVIFTNTSNDGISQKDIYMLEINSSNNSRTLIHNNAEMADWK